MTHDQVTLGVVLDADELQVIEDYRRVRTEGRGALYLEFLDSRVTKYEVRLGGRDKIDRINRILSQGKLRD